MMYAAIQNTQPDYVALAMVGVLVTIVAIMAIRKKVALKEKAAAPASVAIPVEEKPKQVAPGTAGQVKLHNVPPKTAAMLMAIVANKMEKPLNELRFISIKEVE